MSQDDPDFDERRQRRIMAMAEMLKHNLAAASGSAQQDDEG